MSKERAKRVQATQLRRAVYAILGVIVIIIFGTVGFQDLEGMGWVNAFYFESMLATGQGPPLTLDTDAGKIFASIMGFVSFGSVATSLVFTLGPMMSQIWREGLERAEEEARGLEREARAVGQEIAGKEAQN